MAEVKCAFDVMVPIEKLVPNPRNPNEHPKKQIDLLAKIIDAQGWRAPITVSNRSGFIVRGHGRYQAALKLEETEVPVDYQDYENEAEEWADLVADNRLSELSDMDDAKLTDLLKEISNMDIDFELTGYDMSDIKTLPFSDDFQSDALEDPGIEGEDSRSGRFILVYTNEEEKATWMDLLRIDGQKVIYSIKDLSNG